MMYQIKRDRINSCTLVEQVLDRGECGLDPRVVLDLAVLERDVEIDSAAQRW